MADVAIRLREVTKEFDGASGAAVDGLSLDIEQGTVMALLGPSGCGKTTTLRMINRLIEPTSGTIEIDGVDVMSLPAQELRRGIGYVIQQVGLFPHRTIASNIATVPAMLGWDRARISTRVEELTTLAEYRDDVIAGLSHGFRQRVGIAQAIVHRPELVVMDEPIAGLDPAQIVEMRKLVRSLGQEHTVVVSSHILSEISETCDRILVIRDGCVVASGSERELTEQLLQGMRIHVTARKRGAADPGGEAAATLGSVPQVERTEARPPAEMGEGMATLLVVASGDVRSEVAQALVGSGFELLELSRGARELESVFLELSGAQTREPDTRQEPAHKEAGEA